MSGHEVALGLLGILALLAAVPGAWGWGLSWLDVTIAVTGYLITGLGISVGFHRYLTHRSFKATWAWRVALTVAGTLALEGCRVCHKA